MQHTIHLLAMAALKMHRYIANAGTDNFQKQNYGTMETKLNITILDHDKF